MSTFTPEQEKILNAVQGPLPLVQRPFLVLEKELGIPETDILALIEDLKRKGVIRNIAGIFSGEALGYKMSLVAFQVPEADIEKAAEAVNAHPGVSHNYLRDHSFNVWFTIAETSQAELERSVEVLARTCGAVSSLLLKNEKLIKIGFRLNIGNGAAPAFKTKHRRECAPLTPLETEAVRLIQKDMPLVARPFGKLAAESDILGEDELIETGALLEEKGIMRRYSAVLRHREAGYGSNAMTAWRLNKSTDEELMPFAEEPAVTHLYLRTVYPGRWEHPLFAMIHAKGDRELSGIIKALEEKSGLTDKLVLRSLKEFKKQRVEYFSPEFEKWKENNYD